MISSLMAHEAQQALKLLDGYSFELGWYSAENQILKWLQTYRATWIRDAIVEALYQGRYKAVSVQQILALWDRRGQPVRHFSPEFEHMVGRPVGLHLAPLSPPMSTGPQGVNPPNAGDPPASTAQQSTEQMGILYAVHKPIQPFQPELPFREAHRKRSKPVSSGSGTR